MFTTTTAILLVVGTTGVTLTVARKLHGLIITRRGLVGRLFVAVAGLGYGLPLALRGRMAGYLLTLVGVTAAAAALSALHAMLARAMSRAG